MIRIKSNELKKSLSKLNVAIEKSVFNPQSAWAKITIKDNSAVVETANFDYYVNIKVNVENTEGNELVAIVEAETLIPLVSKIDDEYITLEVNDKALIISTDTNHYTFPFQSTVDVKDLDIIDFDRNSFNDCVDASFSGKTISSLATINAKGFDNGVTFKKAYQQFIYFDNTGAITFTDNIYINPFNESNPCFSALLNKTQAQILSIFSDCDSVSMCKEVDEDNEKKCKVKFESGDIYVVFVLQTVALTSQFPNVKLRDIASKTSNTHVVIDRNTLNKALARLMVFDKKFGTNVLDYSKIEWGENSAKFVSVKSKNYEVVPYVSSTNAHNHESVIRFADLVERLKAFTSKEIDISYGDTPAIVLNADELKQLVPEIVKR